jgi:hypothetical protein
MFCKFAYKRVHFVPRGQPSWSQPSVANTTKKNWVPSPALAKSFELVLYEVWILYSVIANSRTKRDWRNSKRADRQKPHKGIIQDIYPGYLTS